jgi:hypothetical protein
MFSSEPPQQRGFCFSGIKFVANRSVAGKIDSSFVFFGP